MRKLLVDESEIVRLYVEDGLRAQAIARRLGVTPALVYDRLERAGIPRTRFAHLPLDEIVSLYVKDRWSTPRIASHYGVACTTVARRLRGAGVALRGRGGRPASDRPTCPRSLTFRAYVLGLVWGDFAVERPNADGRAVRLGTSTTRREQVELAKAVFGRFGDVRHTGTYVWVLLDESFEFVEAKHCPDVPEWIERLDGPAAFAAGYIDAEGSYGVYEGRGRFRLSSCDAGVMAWIHQWLERIGVRNHLRCFSRRGTVLADGSVRRQDVWTLTVNEGQSLLRMIASLEPFARHQARVARMFDVRQNVLERARRRDPDRAFS
jgi:hypothetical protein